MTNGSPSGISDIYAKLLEYEKRSAQFSPTAAGSDGPAREWSGLTFSLAGHRLTCPISRISEIIPCPAATQVPGAKSWITGLANVRGELLTLIDLGAYLTGKTSPATPRSRVLTTSLNKAPIGLLIEEVHGQRHFLDSDAVDADLPDDSPLKSIVTRQHKVAAETWHELNLDHLFNTAEFLNGAAE